MIRGQKSAWVSNGTIADAAALFCAVDRGQGPEGIGAFVVDLRTPGVRRGRPLDKLGQRALNQARSSSTTWLFRPRTWSSRPAEVAAAT
ncbi:MAG: hypothetical protein KatS3mg008_2196 [Acidimicrobiales bacterium]|nr:MAG: hypothetical protein KatS3mg008_2196 [Acidimicrobiales bacterium]